MDCKKYSEVTKYLLDGTYPSTCNNSSKQSNFRKYIRTHSFFLVNGFLKVRKTLNGVLRELLVIKETELHKVWTQLHLSIGHVGRDKSIAMFSQKFWFKGYCKWISTKTRECMGCSQKRFYLAPKRIAPLKCIPVTAQPMARIHIDLTEGFHDVTNFFDSHSML